MHLHLYLHAIYLRDPHAASSYHGRQVELYAEFDPRSLLGFLKQSSYYSVAAAQTICQARDLVTEQMYLLAKMGNSRQALELIINRLGDVEMVIWADLGTRIRKGPKRSSAMERFSRNGQR